MTEEQLFAVVPGLVLREEPGAPGSREAEIGAAVEAWKAENPGRTPDLFDDIMPRLRG